MRIVQLEAIHYPTDGSPWESIKTSFPEWQTIESAIRRLDRDEWPFIWLHTEEPPECEFSNNMFCVMGGRGEFDLSLLRDGRETHFLDAGRGEDVIRIWESDQGSEAKLKNLCPDLSLVLAIVRHFAESAELHPAVSWDAW